MSTTQKLKQKSTIYDWFWNYKIGGVNFFFDTEDEVIEFKNNINNAYTAYKKEEVDK